MTENEKLLVETANVLGKENRELRARIEKLEAVVRAVKKHKEYGGLNYRGMFEALAALEEEK